MSTRSESGLCTYCSAARARERKNARLAPNEPYRERLEWLLANDPTVKLSTVATELHTRGFKQYMRYKEGRWYAETTWLQRVLGMVPWRGKPVVVKRVSKYGPGERYPDTYKTHIEHDLAQALYEVLGMDALDDAGNVEHKPLTYRAPRTTCGWAEGCKRPRGYGSFDAFCEEHAKVLEGVRTRFELELSQRKTMNARGMQSRKRGGAAMAAKVGFEVVWDEAAGESVVA